MAFGDAGIARINVVVGLLARPLVQGVSYMQKVIKSGTAKLNSTFKSTANTLKRLGTVTADKDSFLSPQWFASRARWFVQLRAFWTLWQSLSKAVAGAFEFEQEMANVRAITRATNEQFEALREKALEVGKTTRFSAAEAAQGMVVLSQAGLSTSEVLASIQDISNLAVATLNDFRDTAALVVTTMKAWKLPATEAGRITDVFATSINKTKLNMEALANGFKFISGIAPQLNISIEETTALLGILANRGLSASVAATSLRSFMAALLNPTDKFQRVLRRLGLSLSDVDPQLHSMGTILNTLRDAGFSTADAFEGFRRRAAAGASILIGAAGEFDTLSSRMNDSGRAAQQAAIQLDTAQGQAKQLQDTLVALAADVNRDTEPALKALARTTKLIAERLAVLIKPLSKVVSLWAKQLDITLKLTTRGSVFFQVDEYVEGLREANNEMENQINKSVDAVNEIRKLREAVHEWNVAFEEGAGLADQYFRPELITTGLKVLRERGLITLSEFNTLNAIEDLQEKRTKTDAIVNQRMQEREGSLMQQWKLAKDTLATLEKQTTEGILPGVSPAIDAFKKALVDFRVSGAKLGEGIEKTNLDKFLDIASKISPLGKGIDLAISELFPPEQQTAIKNLTTEFGELVRVAEVTTDKQLEGLEKINPERAKWIRLAKESKGELKTLLKLFEERNKIAKTTVKLSKEEVEDLNKQVGATDLLNSYIKDNSEELIKNAEARQVAVKAELKELDTQLKLLRLEQDPLTRAAKEDTLLQKINLLKSEGLAIERYIAQLKNENLDRALQENKAKEAELKNTRIIEEVQRRRLIIAEKINRMQRATEKQNKDLELQAKLAERVGAKDIDLLRMERVRLELTKKFHEQASAIEVVQDKIREHKEAIADIDRELALNAQAQFLATNAIARNMAAINQNALNFRNTQEFLNAPGGIIDTLFNIGQSGLDTALTDIANLWSTQREEAKGLGEELNRLDQEYQQALSEGNIERARQLEMQMSNLRGRIDDLNNPLKNLANTFRQFALSVVQELQKVIIKMLVLKLISGVIGGGPSGFFGGLGGSSQVGNYGYGIALRGAGGILPGGTFQNFRRFANGGVTGGLGMAILGDNPSGKELVIPSENIKNNEVTGEVRDGKTPINIINVLTQEDVARAMAGAAGQKTIINTIGKDIGKRGPTFRAIHA